MQTGTIIGEPSAARAELNNNRKKASLANQLDETSKDMFSNDYENIPSELQYAVKSAVDTNRLSRRMGSRDFEGGQANVDVLLDDQLIGTEVRNEELSKLPGNIFDERILNEEH